MSQSELEKLDKRFKSAKTIARVAENASTPLEETRMRKRWKKKWKFLEVDSDIYGYDVLEEILFCLFSLI